MSIKEFNAFQKTMRREREQPRVVLQPDNTMTFVLMWRATKRKHNHKLMSAFQIHLPKTTEFKLVMTRSVSMITCVQAVA